MEGWRDGGKDGKKKSGTKKVRRDTDRHRNRILTSRNRTGERRFRRLLPTSLLLVVFSRPSEITLQPGKLKDSEGEKNKHIHKHTTKTIVFGVLFFVFYFCCLCFGMGYTQKS